MDTKSLNLSEKAVEYLDSLDPQERDTIYKQLEERIKHGPPAERPQAESLESLTDRLAGMNVRQHRAEIKEVKAEMDRQLKLNAEHKLSLFINELLEKGGAINTKSIEQKAQRLGLGYVDVASHIHLVQKIRRIPNLRQGG